MGKAMEQSVAVNRKRGMESIDGEEKFFYLFRHNLCIDGRTDLGERLGLEIQRLPLDEIAYAKCVDDGSQPFRDHTGGELELRPDLAPKISYTRTQTGQAAKRDVVTIWRVSSICSGNRLCMYMAG